MAHFEPDQAKRPHDQLTRYSALHSIAIDQNGQAALTASFHQNGNGFPPYSAASNLFHPPSNEYDNDNEDKKPIIDWNVWPQNGTSKLSPSDAVRTATPSANSTESTPSSQRHSIGPEEGERDRTVPTPEIKSEFSEMSSDVPQASSAISAKDKEDSRLLLSIAQPTPTASDQSQLAALRTEEKILHEKLTPHVEPQMSEKKSESINSVVNSVAGAQFNVEKLTPQTVLLPSKPQQTTAALTSQVPPTSTTPPRNSRAFFRAPGHGGPTESNQDSSKAFVCSICNFSCPSKFHYNSHMNTHGDHQCSMCDYTSRTEGRLKKHMRESHTREEQIAAGLDVPPEAPTAAPNTAEFQATMASLMEAAKSAVNNAAAEAAAAAGNESGNNSPISSIPSALDSLRALSEGGQQTNLASLLHMPDASNDSVDAAGPSTPREPPKRSSGGKAKQYACKQCAYVATSKEDSWRHSRSHIPSDKQLSCPQCEFVTEYKHHLEYHIRNHYGSKPFRCTKCNYSCVNKSMLNSHMKSHSTEYQFQCIDCSYQSKYCHSLKMHLRKYNHRRKPGITVDDADEALANDPTLLEEGDDASVHSAYSESMHHENNNNGALPPPPVSSAPPTASETTSIGNALLQPIATTSYANLIRNHEQLNAITRQQHQQNFSCTVCDFSTPHPEQYIHHNMIHMQQNHTASAPSTPLSAILQYLQNNVTHQHATIPNGTASIGSLSQLSAFQPTSTEIIFRAQQQAQQQQLQQEQEQQQQVEANFPNEIKMEVDNHHHNERQPSPTESINGDSSSLERSSTSPMDSKDNIINGDASSIGSNSSSSSSRKRKAANGSSKLEQISQRLQGKNSPEHVEDNVPLIAPVPIPAYRNNFLIKKNSYNLRSRVAKQRS
jgi:hypothetical protein